MEVCNHFCEITVKLCSGLPILAVKTNHIAALISDHHLHFQGATNNIFIHWRSNNYRLWTLKRAYRAFDNRHLITYFWKRILVSSLICNSNLTVLTSMQHVQRPIQDCQFSSCRGQCAFWTGLWHLEEYCAENTVCRSKEKVRKRGSSANTTEGAQKA